MPGPRGLLSSPYGAPGGLLTDPMAQYRGLLGRSNQAVDMAGPAAGFPAQAQDAYQRSLERPMLQRAAEASMFLPVVGDVLGAANDLATYATDAESRHPINFGLSALGLLPFVPGMTAFHGSPHKFDKFELSPKTSTLR